MTGQIQFYVNGMHSVGGVTTWSFQAASFMASRYQTRVVSINNGFQMHDDLFPGQVMKVWRQSSNIDRADDDGDKDSPSPRPTKPVKPTKPTKKVRKPTKPAKPTKPTKLPIEPQGIAELAEKSKNSGPSGLASLADRRVENTTAESRRMLHPTAALAIDAAHLFIPNYLDFAYELAARSRLQGIESRCIGICHCDQENYYRLLTHYAPIIQSFIAVSPRCMKNLVALLPDREADIHLLPYGVAAPAANTTVRAAGPLRLLYAGRLASKQKRIFDLVEIVRELELRGINYLLEIVGVGPDGQQLEEAFASFSRVRFHPGVCHTQMTNVYRDRDIFVLPSETEGTSIALLESMAHGLVPVATRVSGSEDVIVNGLNGFLCQVGDVRAMAESIAFLATHELERSKLARMAQITVARNYRIDVQLQAFEHCVRQTLTKPLVAPEVARSVLGEFA